MKTKILYTLLILLGGMFLAQGAEKAPYPTETKWPAASLDSQGIDGAAIQKAVLDIQSNLQPKICHAPQLSGLC